MRPVPPVGVGHSAETPETRCCTEISLRVVGPVCYGKRRVPPIALLRDEGGVRACLATIAEGGE